MSRIVSEYQAQVLEDGNGKRCTVREEYKGIFSFSVGSAVTFLLVVKRVLCQQ